jgi:hypothetical protein
VLVRTAFLSKPTLAELWLCSAALLYVRSWRLRRLSEKVMRREEKEKTS